jgi:uncharacterized protein (DUF1684 family)
MSHLTRLAASMVVVTGLASAPGSPVSVQMAQRPAGFDEYVRAVEAWRAHLEADLRAGDGWLTLVGLHWLQEGANRVGNDPTAEVPLPRGSREVGTIYFTPGTARFAPAPGAEVRINGRPAHAQILRPQPGEYDTVSSGGVTFFVIRRGEKYGVRVRDESSASRRAFTGLRWYPIREDYRVKARFVPHPKPASIMIANVLGVVEPWPTPGKVVFTLAEREFTLHPVLDGPEAKELFFIFRDGTTGSDTYAGGRFLYAAMPENGEVLLDFNKAHSPPCAFTAFATCPLPPKENALPIRVEAGELNPHR